MYFSKKNEIMKIQANEVKKGMELSFGWGQWLKVERIETETLKNGKELKRFIGASVQELTNKTKRTYPKIGSLKESNEAFKSLTKVSVR